MKCNVVVAIFLTFTLVAGQSDNSTTPASTASPSTTTSTPSTTTSTPSTTTSTPSTTTAAAASSSTTTSAANSSASTTEASSTASTTTQNQTSSTTEAVTSTTPTVNTCTKPGRYPATSAKCTQEYIVCIPNFKGEFWQHKWRCPGSFVFNDRFKKCTNPRKADCPTPNNGS